MVFRPGDVVGHIPLFLCREKGVAVYAYDDAAGPDAPESRLHTSASPAHIVTVHGMSQIPIGIGVETVGKLAALIALVGGGAGGEKGVGILLILSGVVAPIAAVGNQRYSSCRPQSGLSAAEAPALTEGRVGLDRHPLGLVGRSEPGCKSGTAGHNRGTAYHLRLHHRPLQGLETADGAAYQQVYPTDA